MEVESGVEAEPLAGLAVRARDGDSAAFEGLYRRLARSVHAVLLARVRPSDAEELTQEVFLRAHQRLRMLEDPALVGPWLHAMARNAAIDRLRSRGRRPQEETLTDRSARAERSDDELRARMLEHIRALPEAYRETLMMRLVDGLDGPAIAEATGLTHASVRVNLCRGMEMLRSRLKEEGWP